MCQKSKVSEGGIPPTLLLLLERQGVMHLRLFHSSSSPSLSRDYFLPEVFPAFHGYDLSWVYLPASRAAQCGELFSQAGKKAAKFPLFVSCTHSNKKPAGRRVFQSLKIRVSNLQALRQQSGMPRLVRRNPCSCRRPLSCLSWSRCRALSLPWGACCLQVR